MKLSADIVEQRLREASLASRALRFDTPRVDMSAGAVELRLRQAADLSQACLRLRELGDSRPPPPA